ncbi:hypothetical protein [Sporolactobacillus pectinivorans]|uniref:hypothetical protein n=1 Tax=Sporolactobacillus pectinivorans TaxID=1591408 RepID=UPI000C25E4CB|nr:hypothetical protein [Sporolactobacillus pectinivorans]
MENPVKAKISDSPTFCTTTRKIGNTAFLVTSRLGQEGDIISTFARLAQYETDGAKPENNRKPV